MRRRRAQAPQARTLRRRKPSRTFAGPEHGTPSHENAENPVTGSAAAKAQAAAIKREGGGTAGAVTSDMTGSGYETTVTKADGSQVEVHLDSSFSAMEMPGGGPSDNDD